MIHKPLNHTYVIRPQGRLDLHGGALLQQQLTSIARDYYRLWIIDLSGIDFIDTAGLGSLISGLKLSRQHQCRLVLCNLQAAAKLIFEITQLERVFEIFDSYDSFLLTINEPINPVSVLATA